jgi:xylulokinase
MAAIAVIGLSGQMLGCLPVDAHGRPLYAALIHADARAVAQASQIGQAIGAPTLYERTGNILDARSGGQAAWFKQHRPENYRTRIVFSRPRIHRRPADRTDRCHGLC